MKKDRISITCLIPFLIFTLQISAADKLSEILKEELSREMTELSKQNPAPYFIEYRVDDITAHNLRASFGSLVGKNKSQSRILTVSLRIGDYSFDNTHNIPGSFSTSEQMEVLGASLPYEDNPDAIKQVIWRLTDQAYKNASGKYTSLQDKKDRKSDKIAVNDFSKEHPVVYADSPFTEKELEFDAGEWAERLKKYTYTFNNDSQIFHSEATMSMIFQRNYLVNSEGTEIVQNNSFCQLQFMGSIRHKSGVVLPLHKSYTSFRPEGLPGHEKMNSDLLELNKKLLSMSNSPMAEPYTGPAILSSAATGVFFHEIFGHRVEGHRLESLDDGQTFKDKLETRVLPTDFQVYSDPTMWRWRENDLIGAYNYDNQGIKSRKVILVENGVLKNFLMSRRPTKEYARSNGHGRAQPGFASVSRQSNLFIESTAPKTEQELRKMLIRECKKQRKEYGYYFKDVMGGLTYTDRYNTNVFNISPVEVYRIYADGRPDELVTGVELIGTPLTMFSNIMAAGTEKSAFTGFCGAESGMVPVTTIAPSMLVRKIETQKTPEYNSQLPILPNPQELFNKK